MRAEIYQIADVPHGRLAIMPRPRAGDWLAGEIDSWRQSGMNLIVSLLEDSEIAELGLEQESDICAQVGLGFIHFPIPDRGVPASVADVSTMIQTLVQHLQEGRGVG